VLPWKPKRAEAVHGEKVDRQSESVHDDQEKIVSH
jgi:hypothetical protein